MGKPQNIEMWGGNRNFDQSMKIKTGRKWRFITPPVHHAIVLVVVASVEGFDDREVHPGKTQRTPGLLATPPPSDPQNFAMLCAGKQQLPTTQQPHPAKLLQYNAP